MGVKWVEDVPTPKRRTKWSKICDQLRAHPMRWAKVHTGANTSFASMLRQGKLGGAEPGEFEAKARRTTSGRYEIYARYVGVSPAEIDETERTDESHSESANAE